MPEDRRRFDFLFERLGRLRNAGNNPDDCPDVDTILKRCKADGVSLEDLSFHLLLQLAEYSNPPSVAMLRQMQEEVDAGVKRFEQALKHLHRVETLVRVPGVFPASVFELLDRCAVVLQAAKTRAHRMVAGRQMFEARQGAKATGRPRRLSGDLEALGISRDDARELRRAVRMVARVAPLRSGEGVSVKYVGYDRCSECDNPAPLLFKTAKN
jgi:hypothetical protein